MLHFPPVFPFIVHIQNQYRYKNVISHLKGRGALGQASLASLAGSSQARNRCWLHIVRQASIWTLKSGCRIFSRWVWIEPGKALPLSSSPDRWSACHNAVHLPICDNNEWVMRLVLWKWFKNFSPKNISQLFARNQVHDCWKLLHLEGTCDC